MPADHNRAMAAAGNGSKQARQAEDLRLVVDAIPALAWTARTGLQQSNHKEERDEYVSKSEETRK
jgi:hypothetical protein